MATALALATGQAFALGLGPIQVKSGLNQPLVAEIPVLADSAVETNELRVDLASAEDFARVGLNRGRVGVPIEFAIGTSGKQTVIKLTTKEIVREPFLDFLIQVNWSKGKLLREYTVLLDPPVAPAVVKSVKPAAAAPPPPVAEARPAPAPRPAPPPVAAPAPTAPPPVAKEAAPSPAPKSAAPAPRAVAPSAAAGEYGPVKKGETLSGIAGGLDAGDLNQVMLALLKANPKAFYRDNVNALKSGAVLRIPSAEEIAAAGSVRAAVSAIRAQNESWRDAAKPTQVNQAGGLPPLETPATAPKSAPAGKSEHLALVPPKAGSGNETSGAERPGAGSGNAKEAAEARAELSRTKETLATKEQEATELKSRVKQLEDINDKGRHLISLKDSEIADLQNKLKELQAKANAKPSAPAKPELAPVAKIPDVVPVPAAKTEAPPVVDKVAETPKPSEPAKAEPAKAEPAKTEAAAAPSASAPAPAAPAPSAAAAAPAASPASAPASTSGAVVTPLPDNAQTAAPAATKPATPKPATPAPAPPPEQPWYTGLLNDNPYALYGIGGVLLLIGLWALSKLFGKKKGSGSVRPQFGSGPQLDAAAAPTDEHDERQLRDRVARDPHDIDASMELLRHYYVQGDAPRFESLAESMHERVHEDSVEWEEVRAMGEGLSPHHPLFETSHAQPEPVHAPVHAGFAEPDLTAATTQRFDFEDLTAHAPAPAPAAKEADIYTPDFDLGHAHDAAHGHVERPREPARAAPAPAPVYEAETVAAPRPSANDFSVAEDTIGTRLDLARAYLDMGDPEGARSMLDEVLAEGNAAQKEEAHKLLEELRQSR